MNTKIRFVAFAAITVALLQAASAQAVYQRGDGGVTVVEQGQNIFGQRTTEVRRYDDQADYVQGEYAAELAIAQIALQLAVEAAPHVEEWWSDFKAGWNNEPKNVSTVTRNEPAPNKNAMSANKGNAEDNYLAAINAKNHAEAYIWATVLINLGWPYYTERLACASHLNNNQIADGLEQARVISEKMKLRVGEHYTRPESHSADDAEQMYRAAINTKNYKEAYIWATILISSGRPFYTERLDCASHLSNDQINDALNLAKELSEKK